MNNPLKSQIVMFIIMTTFGITLNPMNVLANSIDDIYLSFTLVFGGMLMAFNMVWAHEIHHFIMMGHLNIMTFLIGIVSSLMMIYILRKQMLVDDIEWTKRMISHHSTAITTTQMLLKDKKNLSNPKVYRLAKDIIYNQQKEILFMKSLLTN